MTSIPELTNVELRHEIHTSQLPLLVYFVSAHCAPCKMLTPVVEQFHAEWNGIMRVVKFDVLADMLAALQYGVMSAPELILFKGGEPVARFHGFAPTAKLKQILEPHVK